jgi:hypothetical protein
MEFDAAELKKRRLEDELKLYVWCHRPMSAITYHVPSWQVKIVSSMKFDNLFVL